MNIQAFSKYIKKLFHSQGDIPSASFGNRIQNIINIGFLPECIFDCGASVGYWSYEVSKLFPGSQIVAVEPNGKVLPKTKKTLAPIQPAVIIEECALGSAPGLAYLNIWDNEQTKMSGSSLKEHVQGAPGAKLEVRLDTLDNLSAKHGMIPDLVKLDLQGGEYEALKGAGNILEKTEVFIIEFGCLQAYIERATPCDLMKIMFSYNYCLYDIFDLIYRPYDNALTGGDFVFVKNDSKLKKYEGYK